LTIAIKDANNVTQNIEAPLAPGRAADANSRPVALSTEDVAILNALLSALGATSDAASANGAAGSIEAHLRAIKDGITDTTSSSKVVSGYNEWETVAASQTDQVLGATGGTGDLLSHVLIIPATTSPGAVSIKDGAGSAITVFTGGASSVTTLIPFAVPLGLKSLAGAWKVTTGTNVSVIGVGDFT
jgi:hypothetical protein